MERVERRRRAAVTATFLTCLVVILVGTVIYSSYPSGHRGEDSGEEIGSPTADGRKGGKDRLFMNDRPASQEKRSSKKSGKERSGKNGKVSEEIRYRGILRGYTPISIHFGDNGGARVMWCRPAWSKHNVQPWQSPMFKDLVDTSECESTKRTTMVPPQVVDALVHTREFGATLAGLIFHMSRCGSTAVINAFATLPSVIAYSEPSGLLSPVMDRHMKEVDRIRKLRFVIAAMGMADPTEGEGGQTNSPQPRVVIKLSSAFSAALPTFRQAFPTTPWVFLYRNIDEVVMSHVSTSRNSPLCSRTMRSPPVGLKAMTLPKTLESMTEQEYCIAYESFLADMAITSAEKDRQKKRAETALLVAYPNLQADFYAKIVPHFGVDDIPTATVLERTAKSFGTYAKLSHRPGRSSTYIDDSKSKSENFPQELRPLVSALQDSLLQRIESLQGSSQSSVEGAKTLEQDHRETQQEKPKSLANEESKDSQMFEAEGDAFDSSELHNYPDAYYRDVPSLWSQREKNPELAWSAKRGLRYGEVLRLSAASEEDRKVATRMMREEIPFVLTEVPEVMAITAKWNKPYLRMKMNGQSLAVHRSSSNKFLYYHKAASVANLFTSAPTSVMQMSIEEFLSKADKSGVDPDSEHYYLQLTGNIFGDKSFDWLREDFDPLCAKRQDNFFNLGGQYSGVNLRIGMEGNQALSHFDGGLNFIFQVFGTKRYLLSHPEECNHWHTYPKEHQSARHTSLDLDNLPLEKYPDIKELKGIMAVMRAGDALYIPGSWFHHMESLEFNGSVNCRSKVDNKYPVKDMMQKVCSKTEPVS